MSAGDVTRLRRPDYLEETLELAPVRFKKPSRKAPGQRRIVFEPGFAERWYERCQAIRAGKR